MTEDQKKELDQLAGQFKKKASEFGSALFLMYGRDVFDEGYGLAMEGEKERVVSLLARAQVFSESNLGVILRDSIFKAQSLAAGKRMIDIQFFPTNKK